MVRSKIRITITIKRKPAMNISAPFPALLLALGVQAAFAAENLNVLPTPPAGAEPRQMLSQFLKQRAYDALERR